MNGAGSDGAGKRRSLVCAGGGMRVAWQAGAVAALQEHGLGFDHVDGTSGGIMTTAMLLSGQSGPELCRRWSAVDARDFGSALPWRDYLSGPWNLPALNDADGILDSVFPALGIDLDAIHRSPLAGTFNVADFGRKRCLAVDAADVDAELLAAGMSLPLFVTPLRRDGTVYTDAVWIRDANVAEALRRGAEEIWLLWCIGNTGRWGDGPLEQYVHMIEMSAMGALLADFEGARAAGREFTLHVVRPEHPLPLDPEFYLGRIGAADLVAMGYRDAWAYLQTMRPDGVPADEHCTAMTEPAAGVRVTEEVSGDVGGTPFTLHATTVLGAGDATGEDEELVTGYVDHEPWGARRYLADGRLEVRGTTVGYRARVFVDGGWLPLTATRDLADDPGLDGWRDATTLDLVAGDLTGTLRLGARGIARLLASVEPVGAHGVTDRVAAVAHASRRLLGRTRSAFAGHGAPAP